MKRSELENFSTSIFDKIQTGVFLTNSERVITYANPTSKRLVKGLKEGKSITALFGDAVDSKGQSLISSKVFTKLYSTYHDLDATEISIKQGSNIDRFSFNAHFLEDSESQFLFNLYPVQTSTSIFEIDDSLELLFEESPIAIHIYDKNATLIKVNKAWEKFWGIDRQRAIGWYNLLKDKAILSMGMQEHIVRAQNGESGEISDVEFMPAASSSSKKVFVSTRYFPLKNSDGVVENIAVFSEDVTPRVLVQESYAESEQRLTALIQNLQGVTYMVTINPYEIIYMDKSILTLSGYPIEDFMNGKIEWRDLISDSDLARLDPLWQSSVDRQEKYTIEYEIQHKKGHTVTVRNTGTGIYDKQSELKYIVGYMEDITESKAVQEEIRLNEIKFRSIFENAGHGIGIADSNGLFRQTNKRLREHLGYKKNEIENVLTYQDITHPDDIELSRKRYESITSGEKQRYKIEKRYIRKDGIPIWVSVSTSSFLSPATGEVMVVGTIDDISASRKTLEDVKESELKFRSVFEETGHGVAIMDEGYEILDYNDKFGSILKVGKKKNLTITEYVHDEYLIEFKQIISDLRLDSSRKIQSECKFIDKEGIEIWIRNDASAYLDPHTSRLHFVLILEDITRRKRALQELQRSEDFQKETIDSLSIGLMVMSTSGEITLTNKVWDQVSDNSASLKSAKTGGNFLELIQKGNGRETLVEGLESVINEESSLFEYEVTLDKQDQSWFVLRSSKLKSQFNSLVITLQEITVRKRVEKALEESLRNYRNIYNHTPVMMHSIDQRGKLVSVSNFWLEKLGYKRHEVIGKNLRDFLTEESKNDADIILPVFFEKGSIFDVSYHFITKSGDVIETLLSAIEEGKGTSSSRSLAVVTDITLLKRTERELKRNREDLLQAQSMAKIGNFVLHPDTRSFDSSPAFDEILEIDDDNIKTFDLLPLVAPPNDLADVIKTFDDLFETGEFLDYTGQAITLKSKKVIWLECNGRIEVDNERVRIVGTIQDITKSKNYELEIQHLSDRLSLALQSAKIGVWELDQLQNSIHYEPTMYDLFQLEPPNKLDSWKKLIEVAHPEDVKNLVRIKDRLKSGEELVDDNFRLVLPKGTRHFRSVTRQIHGKDGLERLLGLVTDITDDKNILNRLEVSLYEKDILIKEVHHRVKNNMQMISSILALKSLDVMDEDSKKVFDDCTLRVKSMAVVHDQLYRFYDVSEISISDYLNHLLGSLNALLVGGDGNYSMNIEADDYSMDVDVALLCGLIVSEIVANAFKHGFKNKDSGEVNVLFKLIGDEKHLIVTNNGDKIPDDILTMKTGSLGISLIRTFTNQLEGKIMVHKDNGLEVIF